MFAMALKRIRLVSASNALTPISSSSFGKLGTVCMRQPRRSQPSQAISSPSREQFRNRSSTDRPFQLRPRVRSRSSPGPNVPFRRTALHLQE